MVLKRLLFGTLLLSLVLVSVVVASLWLSLPKLDGEVTLPGLQGKVEVESDGLGIPAIHASNHDDAMRTLSLIHISEPTRPY